MSEWKTSQIKDFGRVITGYTPPTSNLQLWEGDIPFYSPTDFNDDVFCTKTERTINSSAISNDRIVQENSLMVTCIASIGKIALATKKGITNQQINSILFNESFDPKYCYYLIKNNINELLKLGGTTAVPIVNKADFEKIYLRHHSDKIEQRRIAHILSTCDAVIEKTQAAIAKYKAIKQGMLHDLFTRGIDLQTDKLRPRYEDAPELYKESKLGWIPKEWEEMNTNSIGEIITGSTPPTARSEYYGDEFLFVSPADIHNNFYINETVKKLTQNGFDVCRKLPENSICIVCIGSTIGKMALLDKEGCTNQQINSIVCFNSDLSTYFFYAMLFYNEPQFRRETGLQAVPIVNKRQFSEFLVPVTEKTEALKIAERLNSIDTKLQTEQAYLQKMQQLKKGLMEDLLSGRKKVIINEPQLYEQQ